MFLVSSSVMRTSPGQRQQFPQRWHRYCVPGVSSGEGVLIKTFQVARQTAGAHNCRHVSHESTTTLRRSSVMSQRPTLILLSSHASLPAAVEEWAADEDWVLVHDVARPCVRIEDIDLLLERIAEHPTGGLLANRVRDTMKRGAGDAVAETVSRDDLWHALTPQVFRYGVLRDALQAAHDDGVIVTDEAQAIERRGEMPLLVDSARDNIKITWPEDLQIAEAILSLQHKAGL